MCYTGMFTLRDTYCLVENNGALLNMQHTAVWLVCLNLSCLQVYPADTHCPLENNGAL